MLYYSSENLYIYYIYASTQFRITIKSLVNKELPSNKIRSHVLDFSARDTLLLQGFLSYELLSYFPLKVETAVNGRAAKRQIATFEVAEAASGSKL